MTTASSTAPAEASRPAAREAHPEGAVAAVRPASEAGTITRVLLSGVKGTGPEHPLTVFVDPCTGRVRGALEQYGSTGESRGFSRTRRLGKNPWVVTRTVRPTG
ncbi:hypothetical protein M878_04795 [Streptomyces roseochromogenus subsp. oscitans DS 12.976]|uniref:Uncharacterized protein n=1 Tax=Streptomyces roseochromogenus subsp. oscitans DS 12.976 TaxID=1352936 RepID=V6KU61_STRRC|nr:hypothetical protein M878_04795 [Streptomyces roseochromogenus subsp. oscitans DS 12.976]